mgnify:CR=1
MPDDELIKAIAAFDEYMKKYREREDEDGAKRMERLVQLAETEKQRRKNS